MYQTLLKNRVNSFLPIGQKLSELQYLKAYGNFKIRVSAWARNYNYTITKEQIQKSIGMLETIS
jgi:hypothetical protein